ncbi:MAG: glycosyltransferase family 4 protein [Candidatus Shapirobacteria bacterium]|jgi:glycosyltransferase involved in cell wall biosynthesis
MAKFLLLTHIYPPAVDGGSRAINKIGEYLEKQGHQILVLTTNCTSTDDFSSARHSQLNYGKDGSNIIRLPVFTFLHRPFKLLSKLLPNFKTFSKGPIFSPISFFSSLKSIVQFHPDYIIAGPLPTTIILYASFLHFLTTKLFHYSTKLLLVPCFHPNDPDFQSPILLSVLKKADYLWCLTDYEKKYFQKNLKITQPQYFVHGLGVDPDFIIDEKRIHYPKETHLVFIANFSAHKRSELLIQAFDLILKKYPHSSLTLLGQKTLYFPKISTFLKTIPPQTRSKIKFIFKPTPKQIKDAIDQSSFLILPSVHESFGLVFVESLARGKAIIGANTPQTFEVINTLKGGLTFKIDNLNNLTRTIIKLIKSPQLSKNLAHTGYQNIKSFYTWDRIGESLCKKLSL